MSVPNTYEHALYYVETNEHHGKDETFMKDGIDERLIVEARSNPKMLTNEEDLGEDEGVHYGKRVLRVIQMMLRQDDA